MSEYDIQIETQKEISSDLEGDNLQELCMGNWDVKARDGTRNIMFG